MDLTLLASEFFSVFPWWSPSVLVACLLAASLTKGRKIGGSRHKIPGAAIAATPINFLHDGVIEQELLTEDLRGVDSATSSLPVKIQLVAATPRGASTQVEEGSTPRAPPPPPSEVHYIEVSHWWETTDENVLVALGVDGAVHRLAKVDRGESDGGHENDSSFWKKLGAALEGEASRIRLKGTPLTLDIRKKAAASNLGGFDIGHGMVAVPNGEGPQGIAATLTEQQQRDSAGLTSAERARMKMWRARASNSKSIGLLLLVLSGTFLAVSLLSGSSSFEILSMVAFVCGVFLISSGLEDRTKLIPSAESVYGPLRALSMDLTSRGFNGNARYVPDEIGNTTMEVPMKGDDWKVGAAMIPIGRGLVGSYERELGSLKGTELEYVETWVPLAMVKGLGLGEDIKLGAHDGTIRLTMRKSVMRPLCVKEDFGEVCAHIGCPLVSSIGEVLAVSTKREVTFLGCTYDPLNETSVAKYKVDDEDAPHT